MFYYFKSQKHFIVITLITSFECNNIHKINPTSNIYKYLTDSLVYSINKINITFTQSISLKYALSENTDTF